MAAQHTYRPGDRWAVTVPELIARVAAEGLPVRLAWPEGHRDRFTGQVEWFVDDAPTGYLPRISQAG